MPAKRRPSFEWKGEKIDSFEKVYTAAMKCTTREEAQEFVQAAIVDWTSKKQLLDWIGYMTGYNSQSHLDKAIKLFDTPHPIFGTKFPDPKVAFAMGVAWGKAELKNPKGKA